jgi:hypothetical protein
MAPSLGRVAGEEGGEMKITKWQTYATAECAECPRMAAAPNRSSKEWDGDPIEVMKAVKKHVKKFGHKVEGEQTVAFEIEP